MSLTLGLTSALSGLQTNQKGLDLVSHNISNVNTEGYSRKIFNPESRVLAGQGAGVQVGAISREVDQNLLKDLREEGGIYSRLQTLDAYYSRMQDLFGETGNNTSVSHMINEVAQAFETLAVSPNLSTTQNDAIDKARRATDKLNKMSTDIQDLRLQADKALATAVTRVNSLLSDIANLNDKIVHSVATDQTGTADLQDKRDLALQELSTYIDVQSFERETGAIVVFSQGGTALIDSTAQSISHTSLTDISAWQTKAGSDVNGILVGSSDITSEIGSGTLNGLIDLRDSILPDMQAELDELASTMMTQVNQVHNRGTAYPQVMNSYSGSTKFLDSANQTMSLTSGDVTLFIDDGSGAQGAKTTLDTIMSNAAYNPSGAQAAPASWLIDDVAAGIQAWLQDANGANLGTATATINADGKLDINLDSTTVSLYFRDESATADNSTVTDATISVDWNADGTADETVSGFANFFGLNDLYSTSRKDWLWDSDIMSSTATVGTGGTLRFSDETNGLADGVSGTGIGGNAGTLTINATDTLQDIADRLNADSTLNQFLEAEIIPEGSGQRLRIRHVSGEELVVTQAAAIGSGPLDAMNMRRSAVGQSEFVSVRSDIIANPQLLSRGQVQYNTDLAEYYVSAGDNTNANAMADLHGNNISFALAGDLSANSRTFAGYADSILALNSTQASNLGVELDYQKGLTERLDLKRAEISGVNLDEEISQLMVYEKAYAASAKAIQTIDKMLEILTGIIR